LKFSTVLHWAVELEAQSKYLDHYLDDFFFVGIVESSDCLKIMDGFFSNVCNKLGVPIADEKPMDPCTKIEMLGLKIETDELLVKIPDDKIQKLISLLDNFLVKHG
jgi:hypothetical protein